MNKNDLDSLIRENQKQLLETQKQTDAIKRAAQEADEKAAKLLSEQQASNRTLASQADTLKSILQSQQEELKIAERIEFKIEAINEITCAGMQWTQDVRFLEVADDNEKMYIFLDKLRIPFAKRLNKIGECLLISRKDSVFENNKDALVFFEVMLMNRDESRDLVDSIQVRLNEMNLALARLRKEIDSIRIRLDDVSTDIIASIAIGVAVMLGFSGLFRLVGALGENAVASIIVIVSGIVAIGYQIYRRAEKRKHNKIEFDSKMDEAREKILVLKGKINGVLEEKKLAIEKLDMHTSIVKIEYDVLRGKLVEFLKNIGVSGGDSIDRLEIINDMLSELQKLFPVDCRLKRDHLVGGSISDFASKYGAIDWCFLAKNLCDEILKQKYGKRIDPEFCRKDFDFSTGDNIDDAQDRSDNLPEVSFLVKLAELVKTIKKGLGL